MELGGWADCQVAGLLGPDSHTLVLIEPGAGNEKFWVPTNHTKSIKPTGKRS